MARVVSDLSKKRELFDMSEAITIMHNIVSSGVKMHVYNNKTDFTTNQRTLLDGILSDKK